MLSPIAAGLSAPPASSFWGFGRCA